MCQLTFKMNNVLEVGNISSCYILALSKKKIRKVVEREKNGFPAERGLMTYGNYTIRLEDP